MIAASCFSILRTRLPSVEDRGDARESLGAGVLRGVFHESVVMMQAAEERRLRDAKSLGKAVPMRPLSGRKTWCGVWDAGSEGHVGAEVVVVGDPLADETAETCFAEGDDPVEALAAHGSDDALAEGVCLRCLGRGLHDLQPDVLGDAIEVCGEDAVAVVDQEAIGVSAGRASRSCWADQAAEGCRVTFTWRMRRDPRWMTTKTYMK